MPDPWDIFAEMLGGHGAEPEWSLSDLDILGPTADVVPIVGDSHGPEDSDPDPPTAPAPPPEAPPADPDATEVDGLPEDADSAVGGTGGSFGSGFSMVGDSQWPEGPPPPWPEGEPIWPEDSDEPTASSPPPAPPPADPDVAQIDDLIRNITYQSTAPAPDPTTVPDADPIGGLPGPDVIPVDIELTFVPLEVDTGEPSPDVIPIAGDSSGPNDAASSDPAPPVSSGVAEDMSGQIADSASGFVGDAVPFVGFLFGVVRANPWLAAALATIILGLAIALPIGLSGGPSSTPPTASVPQTTAAATPPAPATTAEAAPTPTAADVAIANFALLMPQGFEFSLQASAGAPSHETVVLGFTGPGLAPRATVSVAAGKSVPLKYPTSGCGHWTVRVVAIDGKAVDSKGNPTLENGMTHPCG